MLAQYFHSMPDKNDALRALELVGLKERAKHLPSELSGGEQQRVAIARAITNDPKIILADEPTGNLDEENERIVLSIFKRSKDEGKTLVMVTHNQQISSLGDNIIKLEHGKIKNETAEREPFTEVMHAPLGDSKRFTKLTATGNPACPAGRLEGYKQEDK